MECRFAVLMEKIYGIPSYGWFSGIWCNASILEECGVEIPKTFDEFVAACETINEKGYTAYGFGIADDSTATSSLLGYLENFIITTMKKQTPMEQILTPNLQWAK